MPRRTRRSRPPKIHPDCINIALTTYTRVTRLPSPQARLGHGPGVSKRLIDCLRLRVPRWTMLPTAVRTVPTGRRHRIASLSAAPRRFAGVRRKPIRTGRGAKAHRRRRNRLGNTGLRGQRAQRAPRLVVAASRQSSGADAGASGDEAPLHREREKASRGRSRLSASAAPARQGTNATEGRHRSDLKEGRTRRRVGRRCVIAVGGLRCTRCYWRSSRHAPA